MSAGPAMRAAVAACFAASILAASACSKVETGTQHDASGSNHPGVVRIVGEGTMDSPNPELSANISATDAAMFWGAWLFVADEKGDLVPELATVVPTLNNGGISADGLTITYHLRPGVLWHDGAPFSAADVIFSWHAIMNPNNNVVSRTGFDRIESMTAPDPHTVVVRLKQPYAPAVATFFAPSAVPMVVLPAHLFAGAHDINHAPFNLKPVGTGPFIVTKYVPGTGLTMIANPHYWRGAPHIKRVEFLLVADSNTRLVMMRTGEADLYIYPQLNQLPELEGVRGATKIHAPFSFFDYLTFNTTHAPLDDVRVRRALAMGVDKAYLIHNVMHDGPVAAIGDQPQFLYAYAPDIPTPAYDPKAAAALLDEAGFLLGPDGVRRKDGRPLALTFTYDKEINDGERLGAVLQAEWKKLGVDLTLKGFAESIFFASKQNGGILSNGNFDIAYESWIGGVDPDDSALWDCDQRGGYNHSFICDPRIDAQERIALSHYDHPTRRAAYRRVQQLLAEDMPVHFLWWEYRNDLVSDHLKHYKPSPVVTTFWNSWDWTD
jgi:peptide/nickel transport system substrate-binding protein